MTGGEKMNEFLPYKAEKLYIFRTKKIYIHGAIFIKKAPIQGLFLQYSRRNH